MFAADDCEVTVAAHTEHDLQTLTDWFARATEKYGLTISLKKREVLYQPPPGAEHVDPVINLNGKALNSVQFFKYLGNTLSSSATIDDEINYRIIQANSSFGRLRSRVFKSHDIRLETKIKVYWVCCPVFIAVWLWGMGNVQQTHQEPGKIPPEEAEKFAEDQVAKSHHQPRSACQSWHNKHWIQSH